MHDLLFHKDRAPEFKERNSDRFQILPEVPGDGTVTYESLGKIVVHITDEGVEPEVVAEVRTFAHPDLIEEIKGKGKRRTLPGGVW